MTRDVATRDGDKLFNELQTASRRLALLQQRRRLSSRRSCVAPTPNAPSVDHYKKSQGWDTKKLEAELEAAHRRADMAFFKLHRDNMLDSWSPIRRLKGKIVAGVAVGDTIDPQHEKSRKIAREALKSQNDMSKLLVTAATLLLMMVLPKTTVSPEVHPGFTESEADALSTAYTVVTTLVSVGLVAVIGSSISFLFYSTVLFQTSDILWVLVTLQPVTQIVVFGILFFLFMLVFALGSLIAHGPKLGSAMATIWLAGLVAFGLVYLRLSCGLSRRLKREYRLDETVTSEFIGGS